LALRPARTAAPTAKAAARPIAAATIRVLSEADFQNDENIFITVAQANQMMETLQRASSAISNANANMLAQARLLHDQNKILAAAWVGLKRQVDAVRSDDRDVVADAAMGV